MKMTLLLSTQNFLKLEGNPAFGRFFSWRSFVERSFAVLGICLYFILGSISLQGQVLASWDFSSNTNASFRVANLNASAASWNGGGGISAVGYGRVRGFPDNSNDVIVVSITPATGYTMNITGVSFNLAYNGGGSPTFNASLGGQSVGSGGFRNGASVNRSVAITSTSTVSLSVNLRNASGQNDEGRIDNIIISGTLTAPCPSVTASISGSTTICRGDNTNNIAFSFSGGIAPYNVNWTGGTLTGISSGHRATVAPTNTTPYTITSASDANGCPTTNSGSATITVNNAPGNPGAITGTTPVCQGTNQTYSIAAVSSATSYTWSVPTGSTIVSGQGTNSISVSMGGTSGNIGVSANNSCGGSGTTTRAISVNPLPGAAGAITGNASPCLNSTATYSISSVSAATSYDWTVPTGASITSGQGTTSISVSWGASAQSGNVSVTPRNTCGTGTSRQLAVTIGSIVNLGSISGASAGCANQTISYSVAAVAGVTSYQWTVPSGASILSGQGTNSVSVRLGTSSGNICVQATNACGTGTPSCSTITVNTLPGSAGSITGNANPCRGTSGNYSLSSVAGATTYDWTVPTGASITSGQGTTSISVSWGASAQSGNVSVTPRNTCGTGNSSQLMVTLAGVVTLGSITGTNPICANQSTTFSIAAVSGVSNYQWSIPNGASIVSGQGTNNISAQFSSSGNLCVQATNACGTGPLSCNSISVTATPGAADTISRNGNPCRNSTVTYSISSVSGATTYDWVVPTGASINSGQGTTSISVNWGASAQSGDISVVPRNSCGTGNSSQLSINISSPINLGSISGSNSICPNQTITYSVAQVAGVSNYQWTVPTGASILSGQGTRSVSVRFGAFSGDVCVQGTSGCGVGASSCSFIVVNALPATAGTISGNVSPCRNSTATYSISTVSGATTYDWVVPTGASINSGQGTTSISVTWGSSAQSGDISVVPRNSCGAGNSIQLSVSISSLINLGSISGSNSICPNQTVTYSVAQVAGVSNYQWTVPSGASILSGQGTRSVSVRFGAFSGDVCVQGTSACGVGASSCSFIVVNSLPGTAGTITGNVSPCRNSTVTYSISSVSGATTYDWVVPTGASINSGQGTTSISVNWGASAQSGDISVVPRNSCGTGNSSQLSINISSPINLGSVSGSNSICPNQTITYSVAQVAGVSNYQWTVPSGASILSGQGTRSVSVRFGAFSGDVCVQGTSACGVGASSCSFIVVGSLPGAAGKITGNPSPCLNSTTTYSISSISGATTYDWTVPNGAMISSGQGTTSIVVNWGSTAQSGNIGVTPRNVCGNGSTSTMGIKIAPLIQIFDFTSYNLNGSFILSGGSPQINGSNYVGLSMKLISQPNILAQLITPPFTHNDTVYFKAPQEGQYVISVKDSSNCATTNSVTIKLDTLSCRYQDSVALVRLYFALDGSNWVNKWIFSKPINTWYGVNLNANGCVSCIDLDGDPNCQTSSAGGNGLGGMIPANLRGLKNLQHLLLANNQIGGTIPNFDLSDLQSLDLSKNLMIGGIPNFKLPNLQLLYLLNNNLNGEIPNFNLPKLQYLYLNRTGLSGPIPNFSLPNLQYLNLSNNQLIGSIPDFFLPNLRELALNNNRLNGSIPSFKLPNLLNLFLNNNQLSGSIPNMQIPKLEWLWLHNNQLSGPIPNFIAPNLTILKLANNQLSGAIPNFNFPKLQEMHLNNNNLSGNIPNFNVPNLTSLLLFNNQLKGSVPNFNFPQLKSLQIHNNYLSALPELKNLTALGVQLNEYDSLTVQNNQFTFSDILPNLGLFDKMKGQYLYSPQDSFYVDTTFFVTLGDSLTIDLKIDDNLQDNIYEWNQVNQNNPFVVNGVNQRQFTNITPQVAGVYYVTVTNPKVPQLTLYSHKIQISIQSQKVVAKIQNNACYGERKGTIEVSVPNGSGIYNYRWNTNATTQKITALAAGAYTVTVTDVPLGITTAQTFNVTQPDGALRFSSIVTLPIGLLNDGIINIDVAGGTAPYSYKWSGPNNFSASTANLQQLSKEGNYCLVITDLNKCQVDTCIKLLQKLKIAPKLVKKTCPNLANGSIEVVVSGGVAPYQYLWSNNATTQYLSSLKAGRYSVSVSDSDGNVVLDTFEVKESAGIKIEPTTSPVTTDLLGSDGAINLVVSGGEGNYNYQWSNKGATQNLQNLAIGNYCVTVSDQSGCVDSTCIKIEFKELFINSCRYLDSLELVKFYLQTGGPTWRIKTNWLQPGKPISTWYGVKTNAKGCVSCLDLDGDESDCQTSATLPVGNDLKGNIPAAIGSFKFIQNLSLAGNQGLVGVLPDVFKENTLLSSLNLQNCTLSGPLPPSFFKLQKLNYLNLSANPLNSNLNTNWNKFVALKYVDLSNCGLKGNLPTDLWGVDSILQVNLCCNQLTGTLPRLWQQASKLMSLKLDHNRFTNLIDLSMLPFPKLSPSIETTYSIENNRLTFEDVLPNVFTNNKVKFSYAPQDSIYKDTTIKAAIGSTFTIDLGIDETISSNIYTWLHNGKIDTVITGAYKRTFRNIQLNNVGLYQVLVNNILAPQLTLYSKNIRVEVAPCISKNISVLLKKAPKCEGDTIDLTVLELGQYLWNNGQTSNGIKAVAKVNSSFQVTVTDQQGCKSMGQIEVKAAARPEIIPQISEENCQRIIYLDIVNARSPLRFRWSTGETTDFILDTLGGLRKVTVTDRLGCIGSISIDSDSIVPFSVIAKIEAPICQQPLGAIELTVTGKSPFQYTWLNPELGDGDNPRTNLPPGIYEVIVEDSRQCIDTLSIELLKPENCNEDFLIFPSFTPNDDGVNEKFVIKAKQTSGCPGGNIQDCFPNNELTVFNSWNDVVFHKKGYDSEWDAKGLPAGAYFFIFIPDRSSKEGIVKGTLTILK